MIIVAHGNVDAYCSDHDMVIGERYTGDLLAYRGSCPIVVTDADVSKNEYFYMKYLLLRRSVELVSTRWVSVELSGFVAYVAEREAKRRKRYGGRLLFGMRKVGGVKKEDPELFPVVERIIELRDQGATYAEIRADEGVRRNGAELPISTIQTILNNREKYGL